MHNNRIKIGHVSNLLLYKIVMNKMLLHIKYKCNSL